MPIDRRQVLRLIPTTGLAAIAGCKESDEERLERMERSMQAAREALNKMPVAPAETAKPLTAEEKAAEDVSRPLVLFCAADLSDGFQHLQSELMRSAVRTLEGHRYKVLDAKGDIGAQLDNLGQAQRERPAWLLVQPVEERLSAAILENIRGAGIKVIGLDQRLPESACDALVFCDQAKIGRLAGEVVVAALKRKAAAESKPQVTGRVVQVRGREGSHASKLRSEAFFEALKVEPGIVVVHDAPGDWTKEGAVARIEDARRLQGTFDVIFTHNDAMAQGANQAMTVAQQRENVLIVGIDGTGGRDGGLDLLRRGVIDATIWQPMPMEAAFFLMQKTIRDPKVKPPIRTEREPEAVTPKNLDAFMKRLRGGRPAQ